MLLAAYAPAPHSLYWIAGLVMVMLLILSALASGSETAYFSLSPAQVIEFLDSPRKRDQLVGKLLLRPKRLLATILIFNNLVNVALVTVATYVGWRLVGDSHPNGLTILILSLSVTVVLAFFGEVIPKIYATRHAEPMARTTAPILSACVVAFQPLSWLLLGFSSLIEKRMVRRDYQINIEQIHAALDLAGDTETTEEDKEILRGIVNFSSITVRQIMRTRMDIAAFDNRLDFHQLMDRINKSGFSRVPVYKETIDQIEGILYIKDLLPHLDQDEHFHWQGLMREAYFIPETKRIDAQLKDFQERRVHMAIVVDEYGGTAGLVTLEDIIEEIVGEINDEYDEETEGYTQLDEQTFVFEGKVHLHDFCKVVGAKFEVFEEVRGDSESLGGLLLELNEGMLTAGETLRHEQFEFTIESATLKRINRIRVTIHEEETLADEKGK